MFYCVLQFSNICFFSELELKQHFLANMGVYFLRYFCLYRLEYGQILFNVWKTLSQT